MARVKKEHEEGSTVWDSVRKLQNVVAKFWAWLTFREWRSLNPLNAGVGRCQTLEGLGASLPTHFFLVHQFPDLSKPVVTITF